MGKNKAPRPKSERFRVVNQTYEDKDYEDVPKGVLVPASVIENRGKGSKGPQFLFGEDAPEDYSEKRNMLVMDDDDADGIFEDEVEEEFDQDFLRELMLPHPDEDEKVSVVEDENYPKHTEKRAVDKQYEKMMQEFDLDEDLDEDDPRLQGIVEPMQYAGAMEEFVVEHAGATMMNAEPQKHKGWINELHKLGIENRVFDSNKAGDFVTTVLPAKKMGYARSYVNDVAAMRGDILDSLRTEKATELGPSTQPTGGAKLVQVPEVQEDKSGFVVMSVPVGNGRYDRQDCVTILSTVSTLYNHPNIIPCDSKAKKLSKKANAVRAELSQKGGPNAATVTEQQLTMLSGSAGSKGARTAASSSNEDDNSSQLLAAMFTRTEDETPEEKKLRRSLVKQLQRERRAEKKDLKMAYKEVNLQQKNIGIPQSKRTKGHISLTLSK